MITIQMRLDADEDVTDCYCSAAKFTLLECEASFCEDPSTCTDVSVGSRGGEKGTGFPAGVLNGGCLSAAQSPAPTSSEVANALCVVFKANMHLETCFRSHKVHFLLIVLRGMHTCLCSSCVIHPVNAT